MDTPNQFYVTLPSSNGESLFPENSVTHFKTALNQTIDFEHEEYEVGLVEFHLRGTLFNFEKNVYMFTVVIPITEEEYIRLASNAKKRSNVKYSYNYIESFEDMDMMIQKENEKDYKIYLKIFLIQGSYTTAEEIIHQLSQSLFNWTRMNLVLQMSKKKRHLKILTPNKNNTIHEHEIDITQFSVIPSDYFLSTFFKRGKDVLINEKDYILFDSKNIMHEFKLDEEIDIPLPIDHEILVYSNVCDFSYFGSKQIQILRACKFQLKKHKFNQVLVYDSPHYIPVNNSRIRVIDIELRDLTGQLFPLKEGHAILKLHFRKINKY